MQLEIYCVIKEETFECDPSSYSSQHDARGLYLTKTCKRCHKAKLNKYRPEVLTNPNYQADEPIDGDDFPW